eukprot:CAMPEP_0198571584 /NCGR_PEP_ID=MMETSP1462-20131121/110749_1 /TAXON_ID=1333877 /ORGANISM="Brandtodinium nutriculum, Strain RCC3387" /LENGTH=39 /DNA_ID= /DNA_START= /DNA_END= /DNA_ORIENTATION=
MAPRSTCFSSLGARAPSPIARHASMRLGQRVRGAYVGCG